MARIRQLRSCRCRRITRWKQIQSNHPNKSNHAIPTIHPIPPWLSSQLMHLDATLWVYHDSCLDTRNRNSLVKKSSHCVSLEEFEEMQEEYFLGLYWYGRDVTASDMGEHFLVLLLLCLIIYHYHALNLLFLYFKVCAPYLERYTVQLSLLFPNASLAVLDQLPTE